MNEFDAHTEFQLYQHSDPVPPEVSIHNGFVGVFSDPEPSRRLLADIGWLIMLGSGHRLDHYDDDTRLYYMRAACTRLYPFFAEVVSDQALMAGNHAYENGRDGCQEIDDAYQT